MNSSHPLYGAHLRFARADRHLSEADQLRRDWEQQCVDKIVRQDNGEYRFNGFADVPFLLPLVVSDITHNLRAALDYLVYELSLLDSKGLIKDGTQFPIEGGDGQAPDEAKRKFAGRRESYLKGLNDAHAAAIELLQPYNGVEWTETLRDISNPDKHRHLSLLGKLDKVQATIRLNPEGRFFREEFDMKSMTYVVHRFDVEVDGTHTIAITLPKRGAIPLLPTLRRIEAEVSRTIELFKPEF